MRWLWLTLAVCLGTAAGLARAETIDAIVVTAAEEPVTRSRILFMRAYLEITGGERMGRPLGDVRALTEAQVQTIVEDDAILHSMASRIGSLEPTPAQIVLMMDWFGSKFPDQPSRERFEQTWGFTEDAQRAFFARRLRIAGFVELKIGGDQQVPARELEVFYASDPSRWGGAPLEQVKAQVMLDYNLSQQRQRYDEWMNTYRKNHRDLVRAPSALPLPSAPAGGSSTPP